MKKKIKIIIIVLILLGISGFIYYVFREVTPYDDTKKLYISCNSNHKSFNLNNNDKLKFAKNDDKCKIEFEVRNVDREYVKIKTNEYFYRSTNKGKIDDENSPITEIYVEPDEVLIMYGIDKSTKFEFEYK